MDQLQNKIVMITVAASGLGTAFSQAAAAAGAAVVLTDIDEGAGRALSETLTQAGATTMFLRLDVRHEASWHEAMSQVERRFGRLDVLVNNAGIALRGSIADCSLEDWRRTLDVNLTGVFLGCRSALPLMRQAGGSIINVSSIYGLVGGEQVAAYCAAKGGVTLLTRSAALHGATCSPQIRVNSIHPGFVETPMVQGSLASLDSAAAAASRARIEGITPLGRLAAPDDIAGIFLLLASDASRYITGAQFTVDGGLTAQ